MDLAIWLCSNPQSFDVCSNESWGVCEAGSDRTASSESWGCVRLGVTVLQAVKVGGV